MPQDEVDFATVSEICKRKEAIRILRTLDRTNKALIITDISNISDVPYDPCLSLCYRLSDVGILSLHLTPIDKRVHYFKIKNEGAVKQILEYFDKHKTQKEDLKGFSEGPEEV